LSRAGHAEGVVAMRFEERAVTSGTTLPSIVTVSPTWPTTITTSTDAERAVSI
jgi:hypothetical protein